MNTEVIIEIPKGSRNKYEFDKERNVIVFDRRLFSSVQYPTDYGFFPNTLADDGDPLDALVILAEPTFPGCHIDIKPIGMFEMSDEKGLDEKILCVPLHDPLWNHLEELEDAPPHLLKEIEHFFSMYKDLEGKSTEIVGWNDKKAAIACIEKYQAEYTEDKAILTQQRAL